QGQHGGPNAVRPRRRRQEGLPHRLADPAGLTGRGTTAVRVPATTEQHKKRCPDGDGLACVPHREPPWLGQRFHYDLPLTPSSQKGTHSLFQQSVTRQPPSCRGSRAVRGAADSPERLIRFPAALSFSPDKRPSSIVNASHYAHVLIGLAVPQHVNL